MAALKENFCGKVENITKVTDPSHSSIISLFCLTVRVRKHRAREGYRLGTVWGCWIVFAVMKPNILEDQNLTRKIGQMVLEKPHDEEMNMNNSLCTKKLKE